MTFINMVLIIQSKEQSKIWYKSRFSGLWQHVVLQ